MDAERTQAHYFLFQNYGFQQIFRNCTSSNYMQMIDYCTKRSSCQQVKLLPGYSHPKWSQRSAGESAKVDKRLPILEVAMHNHRGYVKVTGNYQYPPDAKDAVNSTHKSHTGCAASHTEYLQQAPFPLYIYLPLSTFLEESGCARNFLCASNTTIGLIQVGIPHILIDS